jgi:predicted component of type VI protein secretion system
MATKKRKATKKAKKASPATIAATIAKFDENITKQVKAAFPGANADDPRASVVQALDALCDNLTDLLNDVDPDYNWH